MRRLKSIIVIVLATYLYGCKEIWIALGVASVAYVSGEDGEVAPNEPNECQIGINPIETSSDAEDAAHYIIETIASAIEVLPDGVYQEEQLTGNWGGAITISGVISRVEDESCGEGCTTAYNNHDIIAIMQEYYNFSHTVVTGVVSYSDNRGEQQSGEDAITFGNVMITDNGNFISYERTYEPIICPVQVGVIDTILSISAWQDTILTYRTYGQLTTTSGTFSFD